MRRGRDNGSSVYLRVEKKWMVSRWSEDLDSEFAIVILIW